MKMLALPSVSDAPVAHLLVVKADIQTVAITVKFFRLKAFDFLGGIFHCKISISYDYP